jgi:hypothetical protein
MFVQVINTTFRILFFRAGPEDFPFAQGLTPLCMLLAALANALVFSQVLPVTMSVGMSLAMIGAVALVTHSVLKARKFSNRFQQTFNALLATSAVLTLALLPPFVQISPQILELAKNPELLANPDAVKISGIAVFAMNLINFWNLAVTAHIFRRAADVNLWIGYLIAFIAAGIVLFLGVMGGTVGAVFSGVPAAH